jgi:hypothetical protein
VQASQKAQMFKEHCMQALKINNAFGQIPLNVNSWDGKQGQGLSTLQNDKSVEQNTSSNRPVLQKTRNIHHY